MRHGTRLGLDPGDARIGVARSDPSGFLATPVETVKRGRGDLARIAELLAEIARTGRSGCSRWSSGCPGRSPGGEGPAAAKVREWAGRLAAAVAPVPGAARRREADHRDARRLCCATEAARGHKRRAVVDQAAAVVILQHVLDTERASGTAPGEIVERTHDRLP